MKPNNLVVAVDIDGVVVDFVGAFAKTVRRYGHKLRHEDVFCYDLSQVLGVTKATAEGWILETFERNEFQVLPGARDGLIEIVRDHTLMLVTSQRITFRENTISLLKGNSIPFDIIGFVEFLKKNAVQPTPDIFLEDSIEEAVALKQSVRTVLLMDQPWNRDCLNVMNHFERVRSWDEVTAKIRQIARTSDRRSVHVPGAST